MNYDPMEGTSELFASITSDVPPEQWELYKEEMKFGKFIVDNDSEDDSYFSERSMSPYADEEFVANVELVEQEMEILGDGSDEDNNDAISWGCDAADKYAQGKISFVELNDIMEDSIPNARPRKKLRVQEEEIREMPASQVEKEDEEISAEPRKKKKRGRRKKNLLPKELEGLMGAANLAYAQGSTEDAIKVCMELIRLAPAANEPFQTLGVIYDEMGEPRKAFQCFLVAAFLNPSDTEEWIRLAELSIEQNEIHQAISCYCRAIRNEPSNVNFLWERCNLYEQVGDRKRALAGYEMIIKNLSNPEEGEKCVEIAREIAKVHHDNTDDINAVKVLETAFTKFPSLITSEDVNYLLELQLSQKLYKAAVKTFVQHCGVTLKMPLGDITSIDALNDFDDFCFKSIVSCCVPEVLPIDLTVKFLLCLIHLKSLKAMQPLLDSLKLENPEEIGDLFLDVAEAFMEIKEYESAKFLLLLLLSTSAYDLPAVWMKYADCLHALDHIEEAIDAYRKVIEMAPTYQDARLALSRILKGMGLIEEAANVLRQEFEEGGDGTILGIEALYQRCKLLEAEGRWEEYILAGTLLQYSHCYILETEEDFNAVIVNQTSKRRNEALRDLKSQCKGHYPEFIGRSIPAAEMWDIFRKVSNKLMEQKRYEELQNVSLATLSSTIFMKSKEYAKDIEFQALLSCFYNDSHQYTYLLVRDLVLKYLHSNKAWNLFSLIVTRSQENRHNRFCIRLMMKHQDHLALGYLNGHNAMISGTYKHALEAPRENLLDLLPYLVACLKIRGTADFGQMVQSSMPGKVREVRFSCILLSLGEYMCILKDHPNDPFIIFCVGITFIHMACQKFATKRHLLTIQGFAFLGKYLKLKGDSQETFYNIGRALHQLGLKDAAVHYYKKALCAPLLITGPDKDIFDLRREIAYNLCLIYQSTGAMDLVYLYSRKYIVV